MHSQVPGHGDLARAGFWIADFDHDGPGCRLRLWRYLSDKSTFHCHMAGKSRLIEHQPRGATLGVDAY